MFLQRKTSKSMKHYLDDVKRAAALVREADAVLVGVGSGATAADGLCYTDPALAEKWYPEYFAQGKHSIIDIMSGFWPNTISEHNAAAFWGFWARHIHHIRYEPGALQPYSDLFEILTGKKRFIITTNVDGQLEKAGFEKENIFAPQGDYALFQCAKPCSQKVHENKAMVETMLANMASPFEIRAMDVPHCPHCGGLLMPSLRCDYNYVETPHMQNAGRYEQFLTEASEGSLVLLELGVGFNTPGIIRLPFEAIARTFPAATLVRVNRDNATVWSGIGERAVCIEGDVKRVLGDLLTSRA